MRPFDFQLKNAPEGPVYYIMDVNDSANRKILNLERAAVKEIPYILGTYNFIRFAGNHIPVFQKKSEAEYKKYL